VSQKFGFILCRVLNKNYAAWRVSDLRNIAGKITRLYKMLTIKIQLTFEQGQCPSIYCLCETLAWWPLASAAGTQWPRFGASVPAARAPALTVPSEAAETWRQGHSNLQTK
jgi:hypothetical protein